jgi:hypothetical protein
VWWSLLADTYDDRLEDRSLERIRQHGWRPAPLPVTTARRVLGVMLGVLIAGVGVWWLVAGHAA